MSQYHLSNSHFVSHVLPSFNWQRLKAIIVSLVISGLVLVGLFVSLSQPTLATDANSNAPANAVTFTDTSLPETTSKVSTLRTSVPAMIHRQSGGSLPSLNVTSTVVLDEPRFALGSLISSGSFTIPLSSGVNITTGDEILIIDMDGLNVGRHETAMVSQASTTALTLTNALSDSYDGTAEKIVVQRIPHYGEVTVHSGGELTVPAWDGNTGGILFFQAITVTVDSNGKIHANGRGYPYNTGPTGVVNCSSNPTAGIGGGHGGYGGTASSTNYLPKNPHGNVHQPNELGSGGGQSNDYWNSCIRPGGNGGGAIHIIVSSTFSLNGTISANGDNGVNNSTLNSGGGGGGAGGSIWIEAQTLTSTVTTSLIQTNGGKGGDKSGVGSGSIGGGGAGGRIALYIENDYFSSHTNALQVAGGQGGNNNSNYTGQAGTIYLDSVDPSVSSLEAAPLVLVADGNDASIITVTVKSIHGIPVPGKTIELEISPYAGTFLNGTPVNNAFTMIGTSNSSGVITATLSATQAGVRSLNARTIEGEGINQTVAITFTVGAINSEQSSIEIVGGASVPSDGLSAITVLVTARDSFGNPVSGANAVLQAQPQITITPVSTYTNSLGQAYFELRHNIPSQVVVSATLNSLPLNEPVTATFLGADLSVVKEGPAQITAGYPITYHVAVANQGLLTATNVVVTDSLPVGTLFVTTTGSYAGVYDSANHTVAWSIGTMPANTQTVFQVRVQVPATATMGSIITNTVTGTLSETELNTANNQDSVVTTILAAFPQMVITPPTLDLSVLAGGSASTVITITNNGTGALEDLTMLPTSYSWLTVQPTVLSSLGVGQSFTFTVQAVTTSTLPLGHYLDEIQFAAANHATVTADLTVYVHPPLANVTLNANNTANNPIWGAQLSLTKDTPWVRYVNGAFAGYESITYQATTDHNGVALLNKVEVGNYAYQASANKHLSDSGPTTITAPSTALGVTLEALPTLVFEPNQANISVQPGTSSHYTFRVRNLGPGHAENFAIETPSDLSWLSSALPSSVTTLEAGESMLITLLLNPGSNETLVTYNRYVTVTADLASPAYLAASIRITTINTGTLDFTVANNLGQPLENATVTIIDQSQRTIYGPGGANITNDWHTAQADANGQVSFPNLSVSEYTYVIEADGYYNKQGTVDVYPGAPGSSGVNEYEETLERDPFYYTWSVSETTITDTYAFTVEIVYQSDIAEPALFVSHESICTPANGPGYDSGEWLLVNMGPITLTNITLDPVYPDFSFNVNEGNNVVETLLPGQAITVPFTVYSPTPIGEQPRTGSVNVEAEYLLTNGEVDSVDTYGIIFRCNPGTSGEWDWDWDGEVGRVEGHWLGSSRPIFPHSSPPAQEDENLEVALLLLLGDATIERQAFIAELSLQGNGEDDIDDIVVYVDIRDENNVFASGFVITPSISTSYGLIPRTDLGPLAADGQLEQQWLIIPGDLGITDTAGAPYTIQAYIVYTIADQISVITTTPTVVTVYPQPYVRLEYSYSQPDINGDFYVEVTANNEGYGFARNLTLDLSELFLDEVQYYGDVDNNGRSLIFELTETTINSATQPTEYIFEFGDFAPDETKVGRWYISVDADDGVHLKDPVITRFAVKCTHLPYQGLILSELINCSDFQQEILIEWNEFFCLVERQRILGGPINTANGNYAYIQSHPSLPTIGAPLAFSWTYNSLNSGAYPDLPAFGSPMGVGWSFDYNIRLNFGVTGTVILESPRGTNVQFRETKDGFQAPPLVCGTMESELTGNGDQLYNVTSHNQTTYVFSDTGRLISRTDPQGNEFLFEYDELTGNVSRVSEPVSGQFLIFTYDSNGRLTKVTDTLSRMTQFGYNQLGHLTVVTDTRNQVWTYEYTQLPGGEYVLSHVVDSDGRTVEETQFDSWGRAISQTYGAQSLTIEYDGLRRVVTDGQDNQEVLFYNTQDLLVASRDATGNVERYAFDRFQNRIWRENRNGVPLTFVKTPDGYSTHVSNAQDQSYAFAYDTAHNMLYMRDARQAQTFYEYNEHNKPLTVTNPFGDQIIYTYNEQGQVTTVRDENGNLTRYAYNELGWQTVITDALGNASYRAYDLAGRVISTTDASGMTILYQYDEADHLIQQTENYLPGQAQNYLNEYNLIAHYAYDGVGNQIIMTDTLGFMVRTIYDNEGMVVARVDNWQGVITSPAGCIFPPQVPDEDICTLYAYDQAGNPITETDPLGRQIRTFYDELNRVIGTIQNWDGVMNSLDSCLFPPAQADQNLCALYNYDAVGNQILETDPMGRQTRTFYSEVNRVEGVILNWSGTITDLADCAFPPTQADLDLCTLYTYDELGQVTVVTDPMGRQTRTFYDALTRVAGTVVNWTPSLTSLADCVLSPANQAETNICTVFGYDKVGNQITVTNALNQTSLTVYDALNRPIITVANWDGTAIDSSDDCIFPASPSDTNVCSTTTYDAASRVIATQNPMGQVTEQAYDTLGRPITATQYLDTLPVRTVTHYDALGNRSSQTDSLNHTIYFVYDDLNRILSTISPEHVVITQTYDAVGRVLTTTNNLGETTTYHYDDLDRLVATTNAEGNITQYEYDAAGNRVAVINAELVRNRYIYDDLNRLVTVVENDTGGSTTNDSNVFTYYRYNALGNQIATINRQGITTTFTLYDDLNRPITTRDALENQTWATYDALGNTQVITDGNNEVTTFSYNGLNQTTHVSYLADNQVIQYAYDAVGNVVIMTDAVGVTTYTYDSLYRLTDVNDALDQAVAYEYDLAGNLLYLTYPDSRVVTYTYDADNRLTSVGDWDENLTTYAYDQVGRLITTTLPNGVVSVNEYDRAGRLVTLTYAATDEALIAQYQYQLDGLGYRQTITETILSPDLFTAVEAFVANNGLLVLEAEKGQADDSSSSHSWASQTVQSGYAGTAYVRGVPDVGARYDTDEVDNSPHRTFVISTTAATTYTVWVRGMATDASGDSIHLGVNGEVVDTTSDMTGFDRSWDWASLTMAGVSGTLPLTASDIYTLDLWLREDGVRVDRILLASDPEYVPTGMGPAESSQQVITQTTTGQLQTQVIQYVYDPLNRLTGATYTGAITASFSYAYDAVGNMLAYTETVGLETRQVTRYFNDANQLQVSFDDVDGTTSFYYDGNGNLVWILPPGSDPTGGQRFGFDQRNLLITNTTYVTGTGEVPVVLYVYDGTGNRIQQIDYSSETPVTTSYTNHILGLSQVIATHDGATTTYNVFGLGLISQDDGDESLFLLTDGLGSVRTEMVSDEVTSVTGYDPYGNVILYIGESGTVYGFTGEVTDGANSLIYLRARYYNPALHIFMSRDPFPGHGERPQSQQGYSYTENNPINYTDPTGECLDCVLDLGFVAHDLQVLIFDLQKNCGDIRSDIIALILDGIGALLPFVSGLGRLENAADAARIIAEVDNAEDAIRIAGLIDQPGDISKIVLRADDTDEFANLARHLGKQNEPIDAIVEHYLQKLSKSNTMTIVDRPISVEVMANLHRNGYGDEFALLMVNGDTVLYRGELSHVTLPGGTTHVFAHTHPTSAMRPSNADVMALQTLHQRRSFIITQFGSIIRFTDNVSVWKIIYDPPLLNLFD
jgi:RHS repeat-associated protein/uncharacterized repeat protein (TIGR01451 family)